MLWKDSVSLHIQNENSQYTGNIFVFDFVLCRRTGNLSSFLEGKL